MATFNDPVLFNWHYDENGNQHSVLINKETQVVINGSFFLNQLPDKLHGVTINGFTEREDLVSVNDFVVDYANGRVSVHPSHEGKTLNIKYYGRGIVYYPASRIWTKQGNLGDVTVTLEDVLQSITNINNIKGEIQDTVTQLEAVLGKGDFTKNVNKARLILDELKVTIPQIEEKQVLLLSATKRAEAINKTLASTNQSATQKQSSLEDIIAGANKINTSLSSIIEQANKIKKALESVTANAKQTNEQLSTSYKQGQEIINLLQEKLALFNELKELIRQATSIQRTLDNLSASIELGQKTKLGLEANISSAEAINNKLSNQSDGTILAAKKINDTLSELVVNGEQISQTLSDTNQQAQETENKLQQIIEKGNLSQYVTKIVLQEALSNKKDIQIVNTIEETTNSGIWIIKE